jgi:poly-gamma-glutamate synthesis protein (capsule biosynthesis protein)
MADSVKLFLCGDVMLGRGIDQILAHPSNPELHEPAMDSAADYVELAEKAHGPIPRRAAPEYVWGDALAELRTAAPHARVVNLETSVTESDDWLPKGINYRMHPSNVGCLAAAGIDCCSLANNHTRDYGRSGLRETLETLHRAGVKTVGAGGDFVQAATPAALPIDSGARALVFGMASTSSGVPLSWAATESEPGLYVLEARTGDAVGELAETVARLKRPGDVVVASIHWGGNWGYSVPLWQRELAHELIDRASVDVVHGHSSHHPKGVELYRGKLVLYGCGDFLNDYEGIAGHEEFRTELCLMYFASISRRSGALEALQMTPLRIDRFRLVHASRADALWTSATLDRECRLMGGRVELDRERLVLRWD